MDDWYWKNGCEARKQTQAIYLVGNLVYTNYVAIDSSKTDHYSDYICSCTEALYSFYYLMKKKCNESLLSNKTLNARLACIPVFIRGI